jgi:DNA invertase Pin-like site-specific DNA recombinase
MTTGNFVSYLRVSTQKQGRSGLGLEAQRQTVEQYLNGGSWKLLLEFVEVESGKRNDRPELAKALAACRIHNATLVVAKLDRLARNAFFLLGLREAEVEFVCCDMPFANRLTIGIMAMVAEEEARMISERTKAALAAAKRRGIKLGTPNLTREARLRGTVSSARVRTLRAQRRAEDIFPMLLAMRVRGLTSPAALTKELNANQVPAARGGKWSIAQMQRLLKRLHGREVDIKEFREMVSHQLANDSRTSTSLKQQD